jgi:DNA-binding NarL/FixJ family response regulator
MTGHRAASRRKGPFMARDDQRAAITLRLPLAPDTSPAAFEPLGAKLLGAAPSVFLIDDDPRLRTVVRELLEDDGITVVGEAGSAGTALDQLAILTGKPLVALVDVRMPGLLNGIELTRVLTRTAPAVRVVLFTGFAEASIGRAAREAGAIAVLNKGIPAAELVAAVQWAWVGAAQ